MSHRVAGGENRAQGARCAVRMAKVEGHLHIADVQVVRHGCPLHLYLRHPVHSIYHTVRYHVTILINICWHHCCLSGQLVENT